MSASLHLPMPLTGCCVMLREKISPELLGRIRHVLAGEPARRRIQVTRGAQQRRELRTARHALRRLVDRHVDLLDLVLRDAVDLDVQQEPAQSGDDQAQEDADDFECALQERPPRCFVDWTLRTAGRSDFRRNTRNSRNSTLGSSTQTHCVGWKSLAHFAPRALCSRHSMRKHATSTAIRRSACARS